MNERANGATEQLPATAQLAGALHNELGMMARAVLAAIEERDDPEAMAWLRRRAAAGRPSETLAKIAEDRDRQQAEALRRMAVPFDANADTRKQREAMYAKLPAWDGGS